MSALASLGRRTVELVAAAACCGPAFAQPTGAPPSAPRAFLDATCMKCHSEEAETAMALFSGFFLDRLDVDDIAAHPAEWEKVVRKLRTGMMPPASEPRPDEAERQSFIAYLEGALDELAARNPNPGRPALHRLNRTEYANAIHDLLGLDVDAAELLPGDDASFGFDNVAGSLGVSPVLVERYANAAARIARLAVGDVDMTAEQKTHYVPNFLMQGEHIAGLPFGTRGGVRVEHFFPLDAEYLINVDLMSAVNGIHIGNGIPNEQLEVTLDGRRVALFDISKPPRKPPVPEAEQPKAEPAAAEQAEPPPAAENEEKEGQQWEVRIPVSAGPHVLAAAFIKKNHGLIEDVVQQPSNTLLDPLFNGTPEVTLIAHVGSITVDGPYAASGPGTTPSRARIFTCVPRQANEEAACAREILSTIAYRAYRQPASTEHLSVLMDFYAQGYEKGGFDKVSRPGCSASCRAPSSCSASSAIPRTLWKAPMRSATASSPRASRSSSGAPSPTTSCSSSRAATA